MSFISMRTAVLVVKNILGLEGKSSEEVTSDLLKGVATAVSGSGDIVALTKTLRVRPICIMTDTAGMYADIEVIQSALLEMYGAYYLQAFSILSDTMSATAKSAITSLSTEHYDENDFSNGLLVSCEGNDTFKKEDIYALSRILEISMSSNDGSSVKVPVQLDLPVHEMSLSNIMRIVDLKKDKSKFFSRFLSWRSGESEFWKDLVFANDLIADYKKSLTEDDDGVITTLIERSNKNFVKMLKGIPTNNSMTTLAIVTSSELNNIERDVVGGSLSKSRFRKKFFSNNMLLMLVAIDTDWDSAVIYTRGLDGYTTMPVKSLKKKGKDSSTDLVEIMKSFMGSNAPTL